MLTQRIVEYNGAYITISLEDNEEYLKCIKSCEVACNCGVCNGNKFQVRKDDYNTVVFSENVAIVDNCGGPYHKVPFPLSCFKTTEPEEKVSRISKVME